MSEVNDYYEIIHHTIVVTKLPVSEVKNHYEVFHHTVIVTKLPVSEVNLDYEVIHHKLLVPNFQCLKQILIMKLFIINY